MTMLNLNHDQRGLLDYLAERVRELVAAASTAGLNASRIMAEAEELTALRASIVERYRDVETSEQLQLPLEVKAAA